MLDRLRLCALVMLVVFSATSGEAFTAENPEELSRIAGWKGRAPRSQDAFTFVVISDRTGGAIPGKWATAAKEINLLRPDFVMSVGDFIGGYTENVSEINRQWEEFEAENRLLDAPFFYCAGNHDVTNDVMLKIYRNRHGVNSKTYYSFDYRKCHFVVLDSHTAERNEAFQAEQLAWLTKDMAEAKDAEHVFVFLHFPAGWFPEIWSRIRATLPQGRTTVFCGHVHNLTFEDSDGIPVYVLGPTAAGARGPRHEGRFRMYANVVAGEGKKPVISLIPLEEILPAEYAQFARDVKQLSAIDGLHRCIPETGGTVTYRQKNPFTAPVNAVLKWNAAGWKISGTDEQFVLAPGESVERSFSLAPLDPNAPLPELSVTYKYPDPFTGKPLESIRKANIGTFTEIDVPRIEGIRVDGDSSDFVGVAPTISNKASKVFYSPQHWNGPADGSFELRVAHDGERLFVAMDVRDEQISVDPDKPAYTNDGIVFFWDFRPADQQGQPRSEGMGLCGMVVPEVGSSPKPVWDLGGGPEPKNLQAVCKRRQGGYVYEFSIPFSELNAKTPLTGAPGEQFRIEVQLGDRDGKYKKTNMNLSGLGNNRSASNNYARCTFR